MSDPREDKHPEDGKYPTPPGETQPGPGGAGTGTKNDPAKEPAAQPGGGPLGGGSEKR